MTSGDSKHEHSAVESSTADDGKLEPNVDSETRKISEENAENESPEVIAKDETASSVEQKSASDSDGVEENKGSNKNELALAYANRFLKNCIEFVVPF